MRELLHKNTFLNQIANFSNSFVAQRKMHYHLPVGHCPLVENHCHSQMMQFHSAFFLQIFYAKCGSWRLWMPCRMEKNCKWTIFGCNKGLISLFVAPAKLFASQKLLT